MVKVVVSSFYNTLINSEEAIPASTMIEIERLRSQGIVFSVCTNGLFKEVLYYNHDFPFLDYIISLNGSYIYDVNKEKCIYKKKLSLATIKKIVKLYENLPLSFYTATEKLTDFELVQEDIYKIEIELPSSKNDLDKLANLNVTTSIFTKDQKHYLEITSGLTNNLLALEKILAKKKLTLADTLIIAGTEADLPLIRNVSNNYLVSNAPKNLKKYATAKTKSNDLKGVEQVLRKI